MDVVPGKIVTLCGSLRFEDYFHAWNAALTRAGHVVLAPSSYPAQESPDDHPVPGGVETAKAVFERKIAMSDAVVVLNVLGYLGASTSHEACVAWTMGKEIYVHTRLDDLAARASQGGFLRAREAFGITDDGKSLCDPNFFLRHAYDLLGEPGPTRSHLVEFLRRRELAAMQRAIFAHRTRLVNAGQRWPAT